MFKKALFCSVALTLVLGTMGVVVIPASATVADGDLVKVATDSAVYLVQGSQKRVFPHANVYHSWGYPANWSTVKTISSTELANYTDGTAVPFRDGSMFRGTASSLSGKDKTAVFYVSDGKLRDIKSAEIYQALFNDPTWKYVTWVPDDLLSKFNYGLGTIIDSSATYPNGAVLQVGTIRYLVADGKVREFSAGAYEANSYDKSAAVVPVYTVTSVSGYTAGTAVAAKETALVTPGAGAPVVAGGTGLTIALASDTPASDTIVKNAARAAFTKVNLTASSDGDITAKLKVERTGLSSDSNISSIVFLDGNLQIGNEKNLNADHQATSDNIAVKAGTTKTVTIAANMAAALQAGELVGLDVKSVVTSATVNGTLPIVGNDMTMNTSLAIGALTVTRGTNDPNGTASKNVGTTDYTFISAKVTADSVEAFDIELVEFTNATGSASDSDVSGVELMVDGAKYMDGAMSGGKATFDLGAAGKKVTIEKGKFKEFGLRADIASGSGRTINFVIYDQIDIQGKGQKYNFYRLPSFPNDTAVPYWHPNNMVTIGVGTLTFSTGADASVNVPEGQTGVVVGSWEIKAAGEAVICTTARFNIDITTSTAGAANASGTDLTNITLYDANGTAVTSAADGVISAAANSPNDGYVAYTDTITFPIGTTVYTLKADLSTDFATDDTIQMAVDASTASYWTCKGELTNQPIAETPASTTVAQKRTLKPGALAVTNSATTPTANEYLVKGNTVVVAETTYSAQNSGEDVKITKLTFNVDSVTSQPDELQNSKLYKKDGTVKVNSVAVANGAQLTDDNESNSETDSTTANAADTITFYFTGNNSIVIPAGQSFTAQLKATISNNCSAEDQFLAANATSTSGVTATGISSAVELAETYTGNGQKFKVSAGGTLTVSISANTPATNLIIPGNTKTITVFKLEALYEDVTLDTVRVEYLDHSNASTSANDLSRLYLTDSAGTVYGNTDGYPVSATSTLIQNLSSSASKFIVPKNGQKDLYIKADINPISVVSTIATSGHQIGYKVTGTTSSAGSYVGGKSTASSTIIAELGTGINVPNGNALYLRKAMPIVTLYGVNSSGSFSGAGSQLSSTAGETKTAYYFKVAADSAGGNVGLYAVSFKVSTTTASASAWNWYDTTVDAGTKLATSSVNFSARGSQEDVASTTGMLYVMSGTGSGDKVARDISTSQPHTFKVEFTAKQDADEADDSITVIPLGDSEYAQEGGVDAGYSAPTTTKGLIEDEATTGATANFIWSDGCVDAGYASGSAQWYNGYKVSGLDATNTSYQVIFVD